MQAVLDLDSSTTWNPDFNALVYGDEVWTQIEAKAKGTGGEEFLAALTYAEDRLVRDLRAEALEILRTRHDSVMAYHGCRPRGLGSYEANGIIPSDPLKLIEEARCLFTGLPGLENAIMEMASSDYLAHVEGRVWLYFSGLWARYSGESHIRGSELVRGIAERLGTEARLRYEMTGKATLIQCQLSIEGLAEYVDTSVIQGHAGKVLEALVRRRLWQAEDHIGFPGAYYVTQTISAESIIAFIDVSNHS